ncbi:MAG: hypothetical protein A2808_03135 [Candidatus Moranbacteria bacterium RIFCSPHIGHO2_01_FULL_55_24]|nr:MAG: hypothetical protein A2808_03135 [Candidatus Moranbacteria bacterium RIFCSPHIGHO2_01_FULL_55_24]
MKKISPAIFKDRNALAVMHALLLEFLVFGYLGFLGLFTLETLLPTFVTVRFSLAGLLLFLLILTFLAAILAEKLEKSYVPLQKPWHRLLFVPALLWILGILALSLYKFPLWAIIVLVLASLALLFLFWQLFFARD